MQTLGDALDRAPSLTQVTVPDLWQQEAVAALRRGQDVVVQAPTGAGKTLIFELWSNQGKPSRQAIYTVPTRALANDKLAEWRACGWNVGITTGDLSENLDAPILVATLETQKNRLIRGEGPGLLVMDEYQMIGDPDRGLNYELALALAPQHTQFLLLSGSVDNPHEVARWLGRIGRDATVILHSERPVPLDEIHAQQLSYHLPPEIRGYWPRLCAKALAEDLGPILVFAPQRQSAERLAAELARQLPNPNPLQLSTAQKQLVGEHLAKMLKCRVAYHHSGLSYGARAGVIEPLAKAGQLRVVVATMGLAAGINFSLRSVALAGESYKRDAIEQPLRADEILQMFGRAGRRGLDETGYVLVSANEIRLLDARPQHLSRSGAVDWGALLGIMAGAADQGSDPFSAAVRTQDRLFTSRPVLLGVEQSLKHPDVPCGLKTDAERARHVRHRHREILNSQGEWEPAPAPASVPIREIQVGRSLPVGEGTGWIAGPPQPSTPAASGLRPVLTEPAALGKIGQGTLVEIAKAQDRPVYGRASTIADTLADGRVLLAKWVRRLINWHGRQITASAWTGKVLPLIQSKLAERHTPVMRIVTQGHRVLAFVELGGLNMRVPVDRHGVALWNPWEREVLPPECVQCAWIETCKNLPSTTGTALLWRRMGLVDERGVPTRRGRIVSFFHQGDGLAIAAAIEDVSYPLDELIYDLANLDGGFRFCGEGNRWEGRLALVCHERYKLQSIPGYLENGVPPKYGAGAEQIVAAVHKNPQSKHTFVTELVGPGDIDRVIIEWRSLMRQIAHAPDLDWARWLALKAAARNIIRETESPTLTDLPPLEYHQTKRIEHRLLFRRH
ncbi:MAG: DEAD/DEAH box helicase [Verrucomicrobia bacterium]|nr:DEAD/DEAH box helicase [Verrucomicrobiota bacterium]